MTGAKQGIGRRYLWLWITLGVVVLVPFTAVGLAVWSLPDILGGSEPEPADCADAMAFVGQEGVPANATDAACTITGFQDTFYTARFLASREAVDAWLAELPGEPPVLAGEACDDGADLCAEVSFDAHDPVEAAYLRVNATVRDDGTLAVRLHAFSV